MRSQRSLPERLTRATSVDAFVQFLCQHGALGYGFDAKRAARDIDEVRLLEIVPLFFGLIPARALARPTQTGVPRIRPLISAHLEGLGLAGDRLLEDVLIGVADQYRSTRGNKYLLTGQLKFGVRDIRARPSAYRRLIKRQGGRCAVCGMRFADVDESLDHIVPWQFIGDIADGSNWQILCPPCNSGKGDLVSVLQSPHAHNWFYGDDFNAPNARYKLRARYLTLRRTRGCAYGGCGVTPHSGELTVQLTDPLAIPSVDFLTVRCQRHLVDPKSGDVSDQNGAAETAK